MKFQSFSKTVIATLVFGVLSAHAVAESGKDKQKATSGQVTAGGTSFLDGKEEGWFWKKTPPEPPEEMEPEPTVAKTDKAEDQDKQMPVPEPSVTVAVEEGPEAFTVAWYRENVQKLRDRAIDDPTQENVRAYYLAQRIMLDKASRFTDMARLVTSTDPLIDESSRRSRQPSALWISLLRLRKTRGWSSRTLPPVRVFSSSSEAMIAPSV